MRGTERWAAALGVVLARALLLVYPASFRREFGPGLVRDFRDRGASRWREDGVVAFALWWLRSGFSLLGNAAASWVEAGSAGDRIPSAGRSLRLAVRRLVRAPTFTSVVVLTLGLGIGGTTAVFSVLKGVLLEPLPYPEPDRLVRFYQYDREEPAGDLPVTAPHFLGYRAGAASFDALATVYTYEETGATLLAGDRPERVGRLTVSAGYFEVLGARPLRGRTFREADETGRAVAILSEGLWRRLGAGGDPPGMGSGVRIDGMEYTLVGVMPADLRDPLGGTVSVWLPQDLHGGGAQFPGNHFLSMVGRLAPGVGMEGARQEMAALDRALAERYPDVADDGAFRLVRLHDDRVTGARPTLLLLLGATLLVLLIASVNVANLQVVRALGSARDVAVQFALGADRRRIAVQALLESVVLAAVGGLAGLAVAWMGLRILLPLGGDALPRASSVTLDGPVLLVAALLTLTTGLVTGTVPAFRVSRRAPASALRSGGVGVRSRSAGRGRTALVGLQVALALVLLVGASALALGAHRLSRVDLGFTADDILTFELDLPEALYDATAREAFHREATRRLAALPGVSAAAAVSWPPAGGRGYVWGTWPLTGPRSGDDEAMLGTNNRVVEGRYFETLGIGLLEGRVFEERDGPDAPPVAVVSEMVARRLFPDGSAVGQRIRMGGVEREIVGVVEEVAADARGLAAPHVYHRHAQYADRVWPMTYLVAGGGEATELMPAARTELAGLDPLLVPYGAGSLAERIGRGRARERFALTLMATFAGLALTLAAVGLYGSLAYLVKERRREIAVRVVLGAEAGSVLGLVVSRTAGILAVGVGLGVPASLAGSRILRSLVFETHPAEPLVLAGACALLVLAAAAATLVPVLRAWRVSPRTVLAGE